MIIAVDYDGTLFDEGRINRGLIAQLRQAQRHGDTVILWTCREGRRLTEALDALHRAGFHPQFVNCNAPEAVRRLHHDPRKIFADLYIDDKAVQAWKSAKRAGSDI